MSEELRLYPKTLREIDGLPELIAEQAHFMAMATGVLKGMHAANNRSQNSCINGTPIKDCEATKQSAEGTVSRIPYDENEGFTGWVGYEPANAQCGDCGNMCTTRVFWEDGQPTERMRAEYYPKLEFEQTITIVDTN